MHIKMCINLVFFYSEQISFFSLVTDTICFFTVTKQAFLTVTVLGLVHSLKGFTRRRFVLDIV